MPEFENLEPFVDRRNGDQITPVAPHHEQIQEYQPKRRAGERPRKAPKSRLRPLDVKVPASELVSAAEMERAFKIAAKKERKRQRKNQKNGLFGRLLKKIRTWWRNVSPGTKPASKKRAERPGGKRAKGPRHNRPGGGEREERRGGRPQGGRGDAQRGRRRQRKKGDANPRQAEGGENRQKPRPAKNADPAKTDAPPPNEANPDGGGKRRSRGGRNRRRRPPSGKAPASDSSSNPKAS